MSKIKAKVISAEIGKYNYDSISVNIDDEMTSICLDKNLNVSQYIDKEVYLINDNGNYTIEIIPPDDNLIKKNKR